MIIQALVFELHFNAIWIRNSTHIIVDLIHNSNISTAPEGIHNKHHIKIDKILKLVIRPNITTDSEQNIYTYRNQLICVYRSIAAAPFCKQPLNLRQCLYKDGIQFSPILAPPLPYFNIRFNSFTISTQEHPYGQGKWSSVL
jgi:hypothetical protein